jgi:hypothetical protein
VHNAPPPVTAIQVFSESALAVSVGVTVSKHSKRITFCPKISRLRYRSRLFSCACWGNPRPLSWAAAQTRKDENRSAAMRQIEKQRSENQMQNRIRNEQLIVRVTPEEKKLIQKKMSQYHTGNFSRYARKMLIDGYVINVDLSDFQRLSGEVNAIGVNINQIAKAVNATGRVYENDIAQAKERVEDIWRLLKSYLSELLSKIR